MAGRPLHPCLPSTATWMIMLCGSIRPIPTISLLAAMAESIRVGIEALPGGTSTTCLSRSSIESSLITRCLFTTCAVAPRTTIRCARRRARRWFTASPTPTGQSFWAATGTSRKAIRLITILSTPNISTAGWLVTTDELKNDSTLLQRHPRAKTTTNGTGIPLCL